MVTSIITGRVNTLCHSVFRCTHRSIAQIPDIVSRSVLYVTNLQITLFHLDQFAPKLNLLYAVPLVIRVTKFRRNFTQIIKPKEVT